MKTILFRIDRRELIFVAVMAAVSIGLLFVPVHADFTAQHGEKLETAEVISTDNSALMRHGLVTCGSQLLSVRILSGRENGICYQAANELRGQLELDKIFRPGDKITVAVPEKIQPDQVLIAKDFQRVPWTLILFAGFCLFLIVFGHWVGCKALFSFLFSCLVIFKVVIPLILAGWQASAVVFGTVTFLTAVIIFLVAGLTRKAIAAFSGAIAGIFSGLAMAHLFGRLLNINGASLPFIQSLRYSGFENLDIADIFTGALILASSGAIMDLAMDIAAAVEEVHRHNQQLGVKELIDSGMRVGRSVVGTMTTTLLLAYSGGYITLLMMFTVQGSGFSDVINNPIVAAEIAKTLIGSFSLVSVAPLTAVFAGCIFGRKRECK